MGCIWWGGRATPTICLVFHLLLPGNHESLGGSLASSLWPTAGLGIRIAACRCLVRVLLAVLARPPAVALNMRTLAAGTGNDRDDTFVKVG